MNQNNFDEQVRRAVENISSDYQPNSWDLMEQRLNQVLPAQEDIPAQDAEEEFDNIIRQKIGSKKPAYNTNHWIMMSSLLDEYQSMGAWLRRHRVLEIGLTALFLFTFVNVFYIPSQLNNGFFVKEEKNNTKENTNQTFIPNQQLPLATASKNETIQSTFYKDSKNIFSEKNNANRLFFNNEKNNFFVENTLQTERKAILESKEEKITTFAKEEKVISIEKLPILSLKNIKTDRNTLAFIKKTNKKTRKWQPYFGVFAMSDINRIQTPDAYFFGSYIPEFLQYKFGQGLGFTLGISRARWAIETGLFFDKKTYSPADVRLKTGGNVSANAHTEELEDIKINSTQIPIQINFDVLKRKRLGIFALAGMTTHIVMQAKYDKSRSFIGYALRPIPTIEPELEIIKPKYDDGLLASHIFSGNVYGTVNAGMGATYKITPRWSMLGQAKYQYYISSEGIGPNKDKISAYSFWLGLRKAF
jgi:hypothetical protein